MITKIEVLEEVYNSDLREYEKKITEYHRDSYSGDFNELILENTPRSAIKDYAEENYNMIDADDADEHCDCRPSRAPEDFDDEELIETLEERGHKVIECQTIADSLRVSEILGHHQLSFNV